MAGVHKFDLWSMTGSSMIYLPDRIVAGISCMFFILSVLSCYYILLRMFDVTIACFTCLTMILSNLFLQYATSGLPQMMMLFFFAWGIHFLYTALQNKEENRAFLWPLIGSSICFSCVCLTGWIGLWPMAGFLILQASGSNRTACTAFRALSLSFFSWPTPFTLTAPSAEASSERLITQSSRG